ncbi:family 65 glycosyl hydrolase [Ruminococcaceae bacterium OttesenSCG-928-I18]|nr:family 65 glycosyl hydrolase [Ruminococcaceae bacterium OttesenSCG-928-I18]
MILRKTSLDPLELAVEETLFHLGNGYLGIRGNFEEGYPDIVPTIRGSYINGFHDTVQVHYEEKLYGFPEVAQRMVNLPDAQTLKLRINGEVFSMFEGEVLEYERYLDTELGHSVRQIRWKSPQGKVSKIIFLRMVSFLRKELFFTICEVIPEEGGLVEMESGINCAVTNYTNPSDPRVASTPIKHIWYDNAELLHDGGLVRCHTGSSGLHLAICQRHVHSPVGKVRSKQTENGFVTKTKVELPPGGVARLEKYTVFADSRRVADPGLEVLLAIEPCLQAGSEDLLHEQAGYLKNFWKASRVQIEGSEEANEGMAFNLFGLLQSAGRDAISNVAAKGLSGEGYEGHYFWDTEVYIFPFFLYTQPNMARRLLDYRYGILDGARQHAHNMGHNKGALYPWRTITGSECSTYFPAGSAQYHITGDVANACMQYYIMTGDLPYMAEKGAEILLETARLWLDAGHYDRQGRFCIDSVTGPDEYTCIVNNNYYTNIVAAHNLRNAVEIYDALKEKEWHLPVADRIDFEEDELAEFTRAAEAIHLPYDEKLGIHCQDDSFLDKPMWDFEKTSKSKYPLLLHYHPLYLYRHQVCKQADTVLAHMLYGEDVEKEIVRRSFEYYEKITTHDSSLSKCVFSIMAARLGMKEKAFHYYHSTLRTDLDNTHGNTMQGIHTANMGGAYLALVLGFAGMRVQDDHLRFDFTLPDDWQGFQFNLWFKGSLLRITAEHKDAHIQLVMGSAVSVQVEGKVYSIDGIHSFQGVVK